MADWSSCAVVVRGGEENFIWGQPSCFSHIPSLSETGADPANLVRESCTSLCRRLWVSQSCVEGHTSARGLYSFAQPEAQLSALSCYLSTLPDIKWRLDHAQGMSQGTTKDGRRQTTSGSRTSKLNHRQIQTPNYPPTISLTAPRDRRQT